MQPSRAFVCLARALAACALLGAAAVSAQTLDLRPKGLAEPRVLRRRAGRQQQPRAPRRRARRAAQPRGLGALPRERAAAGGRRAARVHRSAQRRGHERHGAVAAAARRRPRQPREPRRAGRAPGARRSRASTPRSSRCGAASSWSTRGCSASTPSQLGALRATQVSDTLWQVSAPQVVNGIAVRDARLALTISHGNVVTFGTESWGTVTCALSRW